MRDRRVRLGFVVLILAMPLWIVAFSGAPRAGVRPMGVASAPDRARQSRASLDPGLLGDVYAVEGVLVAGLILAGRARRQLLAARGIVETETLNGLGMAAPQRSSNGLRPVVRVSTTS